MRRTLWACVAVLSLIMIAVATRRILGLRVPAPGLDTGFVRHRLLTLAHVVPGLAFVLLGPFQFMTGLRKRHPSLHRWTGRVVLASALVIGITALIMSPQMAIGGASESAATFAFGVLFLFAIGKAFASIGMGAASRTLLQRAKENPQFYGALAAVGQGKFVPQTGAVLIKDKNGNVLGAAGGSGGTGDEDEAVCIAGVEAAGLSWG